MEFLLGIAVGVMSSWWWLWALLFTIMVFEHNDLEGWGIFGLILLVITFYIILDINTKYLIISGILYIPLGVAWSIYRWKRHCSSVMEDYDINVKLSGCELDSYQKSGFIDRLKASNNVTKIVNWVIVWPFSLLDNLIGDIIDFVTQVIKKHLIGIYNKISAGNIERISG